MYNNNYRSPWFDDLSKAEDWLSEQEKKRQDFDNIKRLSTKWKFVSFFNVDVKVVLDCLSACWIQAHCQTGCATLHMASRW